MSQSPAPPTPPAKAAPGPTFLTFLSQVDEGRLAGNATEELELLVSELRAVAMIQGAKPKGSITIEIKIDAISPGMMEVVGQIKRRMPKRPQGRTPFWPTKSNGLAAADPAQLRIEGIDVATQGRDSVRVVP